MIASFYNRKKLKIQINFKHPKCRSILDTDALFFQKYFLLQDTGHPSSKLHTYMYRMSLDLAVTTQETVDLLHFSSMKACRIKS